MCSVCKDDQCLWGEYCHPSGESYRVPAEAPEPPAKAASPLDQDEQWITSQEVA